MKVIKCLFWNINEKRTPFEDVIKDISNDIDILVLAEADKIDNTRIETLTGLTMIKSAIKTDINKLTPKFFVSQNGFIFSHLNTVISKRLVINVLEVPGHEEILFSGIHFPSKLEYSLTTQDKIANNYINWVNEIEDILEIKRTIIVGDFNMNPFEIGMIAPSSFNATLSEVIARNHRLRSFHYNEFDYFYNPMWNFMGDQDYSKGTKKLPGSYYFYTTTDSEAIYWNLFENILLRPSVIDYLDLSSIRIPIAIHGHQLANANFVLDKRNYSDHLPLLFNLKF